MDHDLMCELRTIDTTAHMAWMGCRCASRSYELSDDFEPPHFVGPDPWAPIRAQHLRNQLIGGLWLMGPRSLA